jgi:type IV pilus assembly protein PilB
MASQGSGSERLASRDASLLGGILRCLLGDQAPDEVERLEVLESTLERLLARAAAEVAAVLAVDTQGGQVEVVAAAAVEPEVAEQLRGIGPQPRARFGFVTSEAWLQAPYAIESVPPDLPQPLPVVEALGGPVTSVVAAAAGRPRLRYVLLAAHRRPGSEGGFSAADRRLVAEVAEAAAQLLERAGGGALDEEERARTLSLMSGSPCLEQRDEVELPIPLLRSIGTRVLNRYQVLPLGSDAAGELTVACSDPLDWASLGDFEAVSGYRIVEKRIAPPSWIRERLEQASQCLEAQPSSDEPPQVERVARLAEHLRDLYEASQGRDVGLSGDADLGPGADVVTETSPPVVRLANQLIQEAHHRGASDIHVEVQEQALVVRYRIDGTCRERLRLPLLVARPLVARLKIMSKLDIAEHRLPQDGRLEFREFDPSLDVDLRVSVLPMHHGEAVCLRLLDKHRAMLPLDRLGFSEFNLERYHEVIQGPYGMLLHCGPTGSGKSMTLYAALNELNDPELKILTAEDPIEYTLSGINQLQVHPGIGLTFASALRSFLRHDPDIILVGEIRDGETARIAVEAALTGHLLLSTLHTNDAASALPRLTKLGIEPFLVAATLVGVCAQRLVRRLCPECAQPREPSAEELSYLRRAKDGGEARDVRVARGCAACDGVGYRGRTGVHELLAVGGRIRQQILDGASASELALSGRKAGMRTMFEDCMSKVKAGITSLDEAFRVTRPDV